MGTTYLVPRTKTVFLLVPRVLPCTHTTLLFYILLFPLLYSVDYSDDDLPLVLIDSLLIDLLLIRWLLIYLLLIDLAVD